MLDKLRQVVSLIITLMRFDANELDKNLIGDRVK